MMVSQKLQPPAQVGSDVNALLNGTYNDLNGIIHSQDRIFSLMETTSDEALIPTRGGDWDDNGVWRVLHAHTWTPLHDQTRQVFNGLGQLESDALSTIAQTTDLRKERKRFSSYCSAILFS